MPIKLVTVNRSVCTASVRVYVCQVVYMCVRWCICVSGGVYMGQVVYMCVRWCIGVSGGVYVCQVVYMCVRWCICVSCVICVSGGVYVCQVVYMCVRRCICVSGGVSILSLSAMFLMDVGGVWTVRYFSNGFWRCLDSAVFF